MKLHIKYMVSNRCKAAVKFVLKELDLHFIFVDLGAIEIMEELDASKLLELKSALLQVGFELMDDKKAILIEKIKNAIIELVHHADEGIKVNFSHYLSTKLNYDYTYLSNLFSESQGTTIEHFLIAHKIERIKELLIYDELNISEIAWKLNYSSVAHLSNQFKKSTGLSPSLFKKMKASNRTSLEDVSKKFDDNAKIEE